MNSYLLLLNDMHRNTCVRVHTCITTTLEYYIYIERKIFL